MSRAAAKLAEQFGLTKADFTVELVSTADVRKKVGVGRTSAQKPQGRREAAPLAAEALSDVGLAERVSPRKSEEISLLQNGAGNTTQSTLGVKIGKIRARREAGDTFQGKILDLVVFEASRLMKQFPKLNSAFADNQSFKYSSINAGVAFDSGAKLVVYGIENSNTKTLAGNQGRDRGFPRKISRRPPFVAGNDESDLHGDGSLGDPDGFRFAYSPGAAILHHWRDPQFERGIFDLRGVRSPGNRRSRGGFVPRPARGADCVLRSGDCGRRASPMLLLRNVGRGWRQRR